MSRVVSMAVVLFAFAASACTKSHDVTAAGAPLADEGAAAGVDGTGTGTAGTASAGTGAGTGTAGTFATAGTGAAGSGAAGTGNPFPPGTGCNNCQPANVGPVSLPACCAQASGGGMTCGLDLAMLGQSGCVERDGAGTPDDTCPTSSQQVVTLPGCCRPDGKCGSLDTFVGLGCTQQADGIDQNCGPQ